MKKIITTLFILSLNLFSAQVIYKDNFDTGINGTTSAPGLSASWNANQTLSFVGNGTSDNAYLNSSYSTHNNGTPTLINVSGNKKMYIKAKSNATMIFRVDLRDQTGYTTNFNPYTFNLTSSYQIIEIDFTNRLKDGAYAPPCIDKTNGCPVDPTKINGVVFYFNPGSKNFNGTVDIEWISFGESLEVLPPGQIFIRANQVGYYKNRDKAVTLYSSAPFGAQNYKVFNSSNIEVLAGASPASSSWSDAQAHTAKIDLSSLTTNGIYKVKTDQAEINITIADNPLESLATASLKYFYYNRASSEITAAHGGAWSRTSGTPDTTVKVHSSAATSNRPAGTIISSPKGWYDAGDLNKYVVNSGISTYTLLAAFENFKTYYTNKNLNIPESSNQLPDILDEVIWNLDWMLTMQNKVADKGDGSVYHKLSGLNFEGQIMPSAYNLERYVIGRSTSAALNFAAVMATASRIFADYNSQKPGYSATLLSAAKEAYAWAKANPSVLFEKNPTDVKTGEYQDSNVKDEFQWAAVEMFITTGETQYKNDINYSNINQWVPGWQETSTLGLLSIANNLNNPNVKQLDTTLSINKLTAIANALKNNIKNNAIETAMNNGDYVWGSNGFAANQMYVLLSAYKATNDESYLIAAYKAIDYLLGRNAVGISFVTGFGQSSPLQPHHRISDADGIVLPVPGMLVGGPQNNNNPDGCNYTNASKAGKYSDTWCSYSTNEVTINWNAPLAYVVNALNLYQNVSLDNEDYTNELSLVRNVKVFPNPVTNNLSIALNSNSINSVLDIYAVDGKLLKTLELNSFDNQLDVSSYDKGIYILKFKQADKEFIQKIIKN